ncbi:NAD(P)H-dependent flavin oxidoreductase [Sphingomonas aracearum]|uniref:Propionate 3-nitronate monooxygenase n=1 Tax=Sphingomonas aracearum TaxID=2283317 RepID=A0A369VXT8_9SPHN|nr:nitronate monooxygenase [Sphingomonas aracearum]RDE07128.1 nitronate monooxygenase [Sphingomonas aracearum]
MPHGPGWLGSRHPLIQAPMAGAGGPALAIAARAGGAVGSLPCAMLAADAIEAQAAEVRAAGPGVLNLNFFAHRMPDPPDDSAWRALLQPFYDREGVAPPASAAPLRRPFDAAACAAVERVRPELVSFHFGLPDPALLDRVRASGARVLGNATNLAEARRLADAGVDAIIAQGFEAGGHAGLFDHGHDPVGLFALVPQIADACGLPVIAAGGIADARGVRAALALGAAAVQVGTAYLRTPEARIAEAYRDALASPAAEATVLTNLFSGGLARGLPNALTRALGPVRAEAPPFPHASTLLAPLRAAAEAEGRGDYSPLWAGQSAALARPTTARALTEQLGAAATAALEGECS